MQFDTRESKPKLRALQILSAVCILLVGILFLTGAEKHAVAICILMSVYAFGAIIALMWAFREQIRYNPYSYNTIIYFGFSLFSLAIMITHIILAIRTGTHPELFSGNGFLRSLLESARQYMLVSVPFLVIFSGALCISNLSLIRHEGKRLVNLFGILLSVLILLGGGLLTWLELSSFFTNGQSMLVIVLANLFAAVFLYYECMLLGTMMADALAARYEPEKDKDYLIVLGCGLRADGTPSNILRGRLDRALAFYEQQKEITGKELTFVTSGGKGSDEVISESASMKRYLLDHGIPEDRIIEEDRSTDTFENMKYSKELIMDRNPQGKIAFSTTNYHVFRSGLFARRVKMRAVGMGSKTKWYFWPNAAVREFVGLLTQHRDKQALILGSMAVINIVLTIFAYR